MSGQKQMVINTQERAISSDINRLQKFKDQDFSEFFRYWLDVVGNDDVNAGRVAEPNTLETPLRGEIIDGLMVKPQTGSFDILVDPGVAMLMIADGAADESSYKYVRDAGVTTPLTIAAGAVSTRIDVIECRLNPVDQIATDNRDIFDTTTGLFSATTVTKERSARLEYRVRQGVAGSGYPGNVAGWLPLCVASVPSTATSNDDCAFWDVRPLVSLRAYGGFNMTRDEIARYDGRVGPTAVAGRAAGFIEMVDFDGHRIGGRLRSTSPVADADYLDWRSGVNWDTGVAGANVVSFAYLCKPFGLPNWARYTTSGARLPRSPRGLVILSQTGPDAHGLPTTALALPPSTGLGGTVTNAVCWASTRGSGGNQHAPTVAGRVNKIGLINSNIVVGGNLGVGQADFVPAPNTHFPQNAKAVWVKLTISRTVAAGAIESVETPRLDWYVAGNNANPAVSTELQSEEFTNTTGAPILFTYQSALVRIAIPTEYPGNLSTPMLIQARWGGVLTADAANLSFYSFEF